MLGFSIGKNKIFFPETRDQKVTLLLCCSAIIFIFFELQQEFSQATKRLFTGFDQIF